MIEKLPMTATRIHPSETTPLEDTTPAAKEEKMVMIASDGLKAFYKTDQAFMT